MLCYKIGLFYTTLKIALLCLLFLGLQIYEFYINFHVNCCYFTILHLPILLLTSQQESDSEN